MRRSTPDHRSLLATTVLNLRSRRAVSRSGLAKLVNASASTLGLYVDQLIDMGLAREVGMERVSKLGRPMRLLALNPESGWFAGVEFTAQRVQATAVDFAGGVVASEKKELPVQADVQTVLKTVADLIITLHLTCNRPLMGIGIGVPGLLDRKRGVARYFSFLKGWRDVPLAEVISQSFRVPTVLENNLRVIALAERWFGQGGNLEDFVVLGARSGLGLSMVHRGELMRGANEMAGEVGLWTWPHPEGDQAMHDHLSAPAVYRRLASLSSDAPFPADLRESLARVADPESAAWKSVVMDFARVTRSLQLMLDPEKIFLHGPLTSLGQRFCDDVTASADTLRPELPDMKVQLVPSVLHDDAGALGAASLAMEAWEPDV